MASLTTKLTPEDMLKLKHRADRAGMSVEEAARVIYTKGPRFFLRLVVGATIKAKKS